MGRNTATTPFVSLVKPFRQKAGLTQNQLAQALGLSRQSILKIEAGEFLPNTATALKLAKLFACRVEDLFRLLDSVENLPLRLPFADPDKDHQILLAQVGQHLVGYPSFQRSSGTYIPADARFCPEAPLELFVPENLVQQTILVLGCDPALSLVQGHMQRVAPECRAHTLSYSSQFALDALRLGYAHIAGTHMVRADGTPDLVPAQEALKECGGTIVTFATWEQGLALAPQNPRGIRHLQDLFRPDLRLIDRPLGTGSRVLFDTLLSQEGLLRDDLCFTQSPASNHLEVCHSVQLGLADAGVTVASLAESLGLDFLPLGEVRFDLVIRADALPHPATQGLLRVLHDSCFRKELQALPSYFTDHTGLEPALVK